MSNSHKILVVDDGQDFAGEVIKQMSAMRTKMPLVTALMSYAGLSSLELPTRITRRGIQSEELKNYRINKAKEKRLRKASKRIKP